MNIGKISVYILLFSLVFSCSSDDSTGDICLQEVSFEKDGLQTTYAITEINQERRAELVLMDSFYLNPNSLSRTFTFTLQEGLKAFYFDLLINVEDAESCIPLGFYDVNISNYESGRLRFNYVDGVLLYENDIGVGAGSLEITNCDFENKQISGRFSARMMRNNSKPILITNGVFEDACFVE